MQQIWEREISEFLASVLLDRTTADHYRNLEYQFHELGHATGLGLKNKIKSDLFTALGAVESPSPLGVG